MPRSFLSVFGKENLEWSDDEAEGKATTSSKAEAHEKESPIEPRCHLLKTHAKELNMLKRMGFKDRRKNKAALRWTWGNLNEAVKVLLAKRKPSGSQKKLPPMRRRRPETKEEEREKNGEVDATCKIVKTG